MRPIWYAPFDPQGGASLVVKTLFTGLGLDAVKPLDLGDIPRRRRTFPINCFNELATRMSPTGDARELRAFRCQGPVGDKAVDLQPPGNTLQYIQGYGVRPSWIELEEHALLRPELDPEATVLRLARTVRVEQFD